MSVERYHIAHGGMLDVRRIILPILAHELLIRLDFHRVGRRQEGREGMRMHELHEIKIKPIPTGFDAEDVFPHLLVLRNGGLEQEQRLLGFVLPFLAELDEGLPCPIGILSIALGALLPLDVEFDGEALLDGDGSGGFADLGPDGEAELETHGVRLGPDPHGVEEGEVGQAGGAVGVGGCEGRRVFEAEREEGRALGFVPAEECVGVLILAALSALVDRQVSSRGTSG